MSHVTREDIELAVEETERARAAYDAARSAEEAAKAEMDAAGVGGPVSRRKEDPAVAAWIAAVVVRDARDCELERARRLETALKHQYLVHLAREVAFAVLEKCGNLDGKPCRYKRVKTAVSLACEGIEGASVVLYDRGDLIVYDACAPHYTDGLTLYPSGYDVASGDELFHPSYLERYLYTSDVIDGMLSRVLGADEVRKMVADLDGKLSGVCDELRAAHDASRALADEYTALGLSDVVESATKRAAI